MDNNVENENDVEDNDIKDNAHPKRWGSMSLHTRSKRVIIDDEYNEKRRRSLGVKTHSCVQLSKLVMLLL